MTALMVAALNPGAAVQGQVSENPPARPSSDIEITDVQVGVAGRFKVGEWVPLTANVRSSSPATVRLVVEAPDPAGYHAYVPASEVELAAGENSLHGSFQCGRLDARLTVRVEDASGAVLASRAVDVTADPTDEQPTALEQSAQVIVAVGEATGFVPEEGKADEWIGEDRHVVRVEGSSGLPTEPLAYGSIDVVVIAADYELGADRNSALQDWVRGGGHLILAVGANTESYRRSALAGWVPLKVTGQIGVPDSSLSGLVSLSKTNRPIIYRVPIPTAVLAPVEAGVMLASAFENPVLARAPYGFGRVTFLAVDITQPPISGWDGMEALAARLLNDRRISRAEVTEQDRRQIAGSGISDLSTQLHAAVEDFPRVSRVSVWTVMLLVLGYVIVIGPIDYFFVRRVLHRPHLTWLTFPLFVAAVGGLAAWGAGARNGGGMQVSSLDILDIDASTQSVRRQSWFSIYSAESRRYSVGLEPVELVASGGDPGPARIGWSGVPENVFGGLYRPSGLDVVPTSYRFENDGNGVANLPIPIWSARVFHSSKLESTPGVVETTLASPRLGRLDGTITHHLPGPLEDCLIAYSGRVYRPTNEGGIVQAGEAWAPGGNGVQPRDLRSYLTRATQRKVTSARAGSDDTVRELGVYDTLARDPDPIVEMLTFHQAAGGREYTGLKNAPLEDLDLSNMLELDRAVLYARIRQPLARVMVDGQAVEPDRVAAYVRMVVPVTPPPTLGALDEIEFEDTPKIEDYRDN